MSVTQFLISFSIIMMMLSLVSERGANFVKLYLQGKQLYLLFPHRSKDGFKLFMKARLEILAYKQPTVMAEKEREYRVMVINIIVGIMIAALANANFFEIVKQISTESDAHQQTIAIKGIFFDGADTSIVLGALYLLFFLWGMTVVAFSRLSEHTATAGKIKHTTLPLFAWLITTIIIVVLFALGKNMEGAIETHIRFITIVRHTIGFIITGFFLSLGSKFWHDLLDILFKLKNTQQVLSDKKTYTDYDSADKLIVLAETSQYEIVEGLYGIYKKDIDAIEGVVSHGLHTIQDATTRLYKKIIEVEFTTSEAQEKLERLMYSGSLTLNYNTFYLKDYMNMSYTSDLTALTDINSSPVCYACNANDTDNKGTFNIEKIGNDYYAVSNLHVFADSTELKQYHLGTITNFSNLTVEFHIDGSTYSQNFDTSTFKFGHFYEQGMDLCYALITDQALLTHYQAYIDEATILSFPENKMSMFGATSKYLKFPLITSLQTVSCDVKYPGFRKKLELIRVPQTAANRVKPGDSGSFLYYKQTQEVLKGVVIATSDNYAYIFRYFEQ